MTDTTIKLTAPVDWFGRNIDRVILREPRAGHLQRFGEPRLTVHHTDGSGTVYFADRDDVIERYLDQLLSLDGASPVDGGGGALLTKLSLEDGIALRDALFDFFQNARRRIAAKRVTSSSLTSESSRSAIATP
jgi:hypothetical protein